jgi:ribonuclease HI
MADSRWIENIYTDGACSRNPGPGGWATVLYFNDGTVQEFGGAEAETTNNRMELQGAIGALNAYAQSAQTQPITVHTDSEYVRNGITKWVEGWKKKGWKTSAGKPVLNQDLWEELDALKVKQVAWQHVKAHAGNVGNERADTIAASFAQGRPVTLLTGTTPAQTNQEKPMATKVEASSESSNLANVLDRLRLADEIATKGYLITTQELAELVGISAAAVSDRGEEWSWRNWTVSRSRKEGNQVLWQLEGVS